MIIFYILTTSSLDNVWTLLRENCCWSPLGLKGLRIPSGRRRTSLLFYKEQIQLAAKAGLELAASKSQV